MPNLNIIADGQEQTSHVCTLLAQRGIYLRLWTHGASQSLEDALGVIVDYFIHHCDHCRLYFKLNATTGAPRQYTLGDYPDNDMEPMGYSEFVDTVAYNEG